MLKGNSLTAEKKKLGSRLMTTPQSATNLLLRCPSQFFSKIKTEQDEEYSQFSDGIRRK